MMQTDSERFFCDCGTPYHAIDLTPDGEGNEMVLCVTLWHDPPTLWERVKGAWRVLRGKPHCFDEVYLRGDSLRGFIAYVSNLRPQTSSTVTTTHGVTYTFKGG